jgi:hypothetical protein
MFSASAAHSWCSSVCEGLSLASDCFSLPSTSSLCRAFSYKADSNVPRCSSSVRMKELYTVQVILILLSLQHSELDTRRHHDAQSCDSDASSAFQRSAQKQDAKSLCIPVGKLRGRRSYPIRWDHTYRTNSCYMSLRCRAWTHRCSYFRHLNSGSLDPITR